MPAFYFYRNRAVFARFYMILINFWAFSRQYWPKSKFYSCYIE